MSTTSSSPSRARLMRIGIFLLGAMLGALTLRLVGLGDEGTGEAARLSDGDRAAQQPSDSADSGIPTTFRIGSLNVLGAGHTAPGGDRHGYASGAERMAKQVAVIRHERVDVVGFQELQKSQFDVFTQMTAGQYGIWPGNIDGPGFLRNSIAWRTRTWSFVKGSWIRVPYFHGETLRMPVALLQNVTTGQQAYFMNFQNPANARGDANRWRVAGRTLQINLVNRLRTTGLPVYWTGDFNDRDKAFCDVTKRTDLVSASGGSNTSSCLPARPMAVDWVFGSLETSFSGYSADRRRLIQESTDHPFILATASLPPDLDPICPEEPPTTP